MHRVRTIILGIKKKEINFPRKITRGFQTESMAFAGLSIPYEADKIKANYETPNCSRFEPIRTCQKTTGRDII